VDGAVDCFVPRDWEGIKPCTFPALFRNLERRKRIPEFKPEGEISTFPKLGSWLNAIKGPVSKRGWCFQERELSPRIIHFTRDRILWECRVAIASEDLPQMELKEETDPSFEGFMLQPVWHILDVEYQPINPDLAVDPDLVSIARWSALVQTYSQRLLSVPTDKLPAISGVAATIAPPAWKDGDDVYLAGIWKNSLIKGIAWFHSAMPSHVPCNQSCGHHRVQIWEYPYGHGLRMMGRLPSMETYGFTMHGRKPQMRTARSYGRKRQAQSWKPPTLSKLALTLSVVSPTAKSFSPMGHGNRSE
jgi:hypothetical protein